MQTPAEARKFAHERFSEYLLRNGLKQTRQRETILDAFLESEGHITSEELHERVREPHPEIGAATVYRTLKLFCDARLAHAHHFRHGVTLYELEGYHHDHLICLGCAEIVEFECELIEVEQAKIAQAHDYKLTQHRHTLYGYCPKCRESL
ncbi:MAG: transcriptional repressor [bacterium]|nr:transcriptional repressor [bacterium]